MSTKENEMYEQLHEALRGIGFATDDVDGLEWEAEWHQGQATVRVFTADWKYTADAMKMEPLDTPVVSMILPHQCDSWEIVNTQFGDDTVENMVERAQGFLNDLVAGMAMLRLVQRLIQSHGRA